MTDSCTWADVIHAVGDELLRLKALGYIGFGLVALALVCWKPPWRRSAS